MEKVKINDRDVRKKEKKFLNLLNDLESLDRVGISHTSSFKKACHHKRQKVKNSLNELVKELRMYGPKNPELQRYL